MNILMISRSVYAADVRVRREAEALASAGHRVTMIGLGPDDAPSPYIAVRGIGEISGIAPAKVTPPRAVSAIGRWLLLPNHRAAAIRQFHSKARERFGGLHLRPDVVHAHDFPALAVGRAIADEAGSRLVYDSHELWLGMAHGGRPAPLERRANLRKEGELARSADAVITVSDGAARYLELWHDLEQVHVIRNTFSPVETAHPPFEPKGIVYAGRISRGRDLGTVVEAASRTNLPLHLIGPQDGSVVLPAGVHLHEPASLDVVARLTCDHGIAAIPLVKGPLNHDVALPNKLFEAISLGVPILGANLPEISALVESLGVGHLYTPGDPQSAALAIGTIVSDYRNLVDNAENARHELDWAHDEAHLVSIYESLA